MLIRLAIELHIFIAMEGSAVAISVLVTGFVILGLFFTMVSSSPRSR